MESLLGAERKATTVCGHFLVVVIQDSSLVELRHQLVDLLGATDKGAEGQLMIRALLLDLSNLFRVRSIKIAS